MSFSITKEFSKTAKALIGGAEITRKAIYTVPQFGPSPEKSTDTLYTAEEALEVVQEAINYFGADGLVRHLNWSIIVAVQRRSNNDLRTDGAGLPASDQARIDTIMSLARRVAEMETGELNDKGEYVADKKSEAYIAAMRASVESSILKPKFADLAPVFKGVNASDKPLEIDLTPAFSLNPKAADKPAETPAETTEPAAA